jgi:hypothetical protein
MLSTVNVDRRRRHAFHLKLSSSVTSFDKSLSQKNASVKSVEMLEIQTKILLMNRVVLVPARSAPLLHPVELAQNRHPTPLRFHKATGGVVTSGVGGRTTGVTSEFRADADRPVGQICVAGLPGPCH